MQKQKSHNLPKFIITMAIILLIGILFGVVSYYLMGNNEIKIQQVNKEKLSDDKISNNSEDNKIENEIDISDWKTYRNEEYGFELKYPENWELENENATKIIFISPLKKEGLLLEGIDIIYNFKTIEEILNEEIMIDPYSNPQKFEKFINLHPDIKDIEINNKNGKQYETRMAWLGGSQNIIVSILSPDENTFEIRANKKYELIYNQILSTFKFTDKLEKVEALLYKYDWGNENCTSFIKNGGFGLSASNKRDCNKWIDFADELIYYKLDKNENLEDYFCNRNDNIRSKYYFSSLSGHNGLLNCEIIEHDAGYENVLRSGYICYREPCEVMCGDAPPIESCKFRDVFIAYTENVEFPIVAIGQNWGENCISDADIKKINGLDFHFKHSEIDILMQKRLKECKIKNKNIISEFNDYIKKFDLNSKEISTDCPDFVEDIDSNIYNTVKIGEQCWMKENLKVTKDPKGEKIIRYCLNNNPSSCNNDGGLYNWGTAMDGSVKESAQGICPNGWHIPKDSEWFVLENYLKDEGQTCSQNRKGWSCDSVGTKIRINGSSGFEAPFTGYRDIDKYGTIHSWGRYAGFWSSSIYGDEAWYRFIRSDESRILRTATNREYGHAVRCLKD